MTYTVEDAENDSYLIKSYSDINLTTLSLNSIIKDQQLNTLSSQTLQLARIKRFMETAVSAELSNLKIDDQDTSNDVTKSSPEESYVNVENDHMREDFYSSKNESILGDSTIRSMQLFNMFLMNLPQTYDIKKIPNLDYSLFMNTTPSTDTSVKQLQRDIQRDQLLVNNQLFLGAEGGLEGAVNTLKITMESIMNECSLPIEQLDNYPDLYHKILHTANRTNSGGISYAALQSLLSNPSRPPATPKSSSLLPSYLLGTTMMSNVSNNNRESYDSDTQKDPAVVEEDDDDVAHDVDILSHYLITPVSQLAPPICIRISIDYINIDSKGQIVPDIDHQPGTPNIAQTPEKSTSRNSISSMIWNRFSFGSRKSVISTWGLKIDIESTTVFDLKPLHETQKIDRNSMINNENFNLIKVIYMNTIYVPLKLDPSVGGTTKYDINMNYGTVELSRFKGSSMKDLST